MAENKKDQEMKDRQNDQRNQGKQQPENINEQRSKDKQNKREDEEEQEDAEITASARAEQGDDQDDLQEAPARKQPHDPKTPKAGEPKQNDTKQPGKNQA